MIDEIRKELERKAAEPESTGVLSIRPANEWVEEARLRPDPVTWFHGMIVDGEVTVLFASSNVGKSILAVQIAEEIAAEHKVLYIDLELSDKQFQMRYTDGDRVHVFPDNFLRAQIRPEMLDSDMEDSIICSIDESIRGGVRVAILDNLSFVTGGSEKAEAASRIMKKLLMLKGLYHIALIVIAHTPKRYGDTPLGLNDLAGSAVYMNLIDAAIAIGRSATDRELRYIKQVKVRTDQFLHDDENVMVCEVRKVDAMLRFEMLRCEPERMHLRPPRDMDERMKEVVRLTSEGKSVRAIEQELGLSHGTAQRMRQRAVETLEKQAAVPTVPGVPHDTGGTPGTPGVDEDMPDFG